MNLNNAVIGLLDNDLHTGEPGRSRFGEAR
jgi:hypothetical protein